MNRTTISLCTLAFVSAIASNAVQAKPPHGHGNPADRLTSELGLDEAQTAEVRAIFEDARASHDEVRDQSHETFCSIRAQTDERLFDVLNEDQRLQFAELQTRRAERSLASDSQGWNDDTDLDKGQGGNRRGHKPGGMDAHRQGPPPDCSA